MDTPTYVYIVVNADGLWIRVFSTARAARMYLLTVEARNMRAHDQIQTVQLTDEAGVLRLTLAQDADIASVPDELRAESRNSDLLRRPASRR